MCSLFFLKFRHSCHVVITRFNIEIGVRIYLTLHGRWLRHRRIEISEDFGTKAPLLKFAALWQKAENGKWYVSVYRSTKAVGYFPEEPVQYYYLKGSDVIYSKFVFFLCFMFAHNTLKSRGFKEQPRDFQLWSFSPHHKLSLRHMVQSLTFSI